MRKGPLKRWHALKVDVRGERHHRRTNVSQLRGVYYRPAARGRLVLRYQSRTDDHTLVSKAWIAATEKARELGWIE